MPSLRAIASLGAGVDHAMRPGLLPPGVDILRIVSEAGRLTPEAVAPVGGGGRGGGAEGGRGRSRPPPSVCICIVEGA